MRLVRYLLYLCRVSDGFGGTFSIYEERLKISDTCGKQNDSVLARLNTQFKVKESFKLLPACYKKVKNIWR